MKKILSVLCISCLLTLSACASKTSPEIVPPPPENAKVSEKTPTKEDMMKKWMEYSTPGAEHKVLNRFVGKWDYTVKFWMDPSAAPQVSKGKAEYRWVFGGRYLEQNVKGKSMGQLFEGKGIMAYDKATNKYRSVWYDSMGTGLMIGSGLFDSQSGTLTEAGSSSCPIKGTIPYRFVTTFKDKNHFTSEMFMENPHTGVEMKGMQLDYSRGK